MTDGLMSYARMRKEFGQHAVRQAEVPVEYAVSLPLPTLRWSVPGYGGFAGAALRSPRQPLRLQEPDRWWLLEPDRGGLLAYARTAVVPFGIDPAQSAPLVVLPLATRTVAETLEDLRVFDEMMTLAAGPFFAGEPGDAGLRADLATIIGTQAGAAEVLHWYQALAPDFFRWLGQ